MANIFKAKTLVGRTGIFSHEVIAPNLVYNTGDQTISGIKTFATGVNINGHVGIGINNNNFNLYVRKSPAGVTVNPDVNSIAVFEGSGNSHITILASDSQAGGVVLGSPADNFGAYLTWNHENNALKLATANPNGFIQLLTNDEAEAVRITSGANVGIGTTSPSEKLEVIGNILANNLVYNTGYQTINGLKDFTTRPTVNTIPVLLSGEVNTTISGVLYSAQINIKNNNGSTIYKGQPVYVSSAAGTNILVKLASNSGEQTSSKTLGLVYQTSLAQNAQGTIVTEGLLQGFNTNAGEEGDPIWLGPTGSLIFGLANKPYAPNHLVYLGVLTRKHANQGEVFVKIQNGFELEELHNVNINHTYPLGNNQVLKYNSQSGLWFNSSLTSNDLTDANNIVYTTGDQIIYNNKIFLNNIGVSGTGVFNAIDLNNVDILSISGVDVSIVNGNVSLTNRPTVNGTGVVLSGELEGMIINSGSLLDQKINSLSGWAASADNLFLTGSNLNNRIDFLSGSAVLTYGNQNVYGIKYFYSGIVITGDGSTNGGFTLIAKNSAGTNGLQFNPAQEGGAGNLYFNAGTTSRLYNVGDSTLQFYANSNQYRVANSLTIGNGSDIADHTAYVVNRYGYFGIGSGFSNPLERLHVSGGNLRVDGNIIGNNVLGNNLVYNTENQTISGVKTFIGNTNISGNLNVTGNIFLSGNPVLTGSNHTHLWSQSIYDSQVGVSDAGFAGRNSAGKLILHAGTQNTAVPSFYGWDGFQNTSFTAATARTNLGLTSTATAVENTFVRTTGDQTILGQKTFSGTTTVIGHFAATSKSFLIDHPLDNNKKLQYASLEGPEHGVFLRGKTNENIINLPNYWSALVDENTISVNLTPINVYSNIYVVDYNNSRVITSGNDGNYYFYTIYGERKDIPKLTVEF